jgi:hypothetical protein
VDKLKSPAMISKVGKSEQMLKDCFQRVQEELLANTIERSLANRILVRTCVRLALFICGKGKGLGKDSAAPSSLDDIWARFETEVKNPSSVLASSSDGQDGQDCKKDKTVPNLTDAADPSWNMINSHGFQIGPSTFSFRFELFLLIVS